METKNTTKREYTDAQKSLATRLQILFAAALPNKATVDAYRLIAEHDAKMEGEMLQWASSSDRYAERAERLADELHRLRSIVCEDDAALIDSALAETPAQTPSGAMSGQIVRIGTMNVSGEEVTGYVIAAPREQLAALKESPLYRPVSMAVTGPAYAPMSQAKEGDA